MKHRFKNKQGLSILLVIMLLSFLLLVAFNVVTVYRKEVGFSTSQSLSTWAASAADSGIEHAEYKVFEVDRALPTTTTDSYIGSTSSPILLDNGSWYYVKVPQVTATFTMLKSIGGFKGVQRSFEITFYEKK